jgi:hypothetical protein
MRDGQGAKGAIDWRRETFLQHPRYHEAHLTGPNRFRHRARQPRYHRGQNGQLMPAFR